MTKACYVGVDGIAKKVTKVYTGVDNIARKVKKGYIGVGGVARPFFSSEFKADYYGVATKLPKSIAESSSYPWLGASMKNYAIFTRGYTVTAYTNKLVQITCASLLYTYVSAISPAFGDKVAICAYEVNSYDEGDASFAISFEFYNQTLVHSSIYYSLIVGGVTDYYKSFHAMAPLGNTHVIAYKAYSKKCCALNASYVQSATPELRQYVEEPIVDYIGDSVMVAGGGNYNPISTYYDSLVDIYTPTLTRQAVSDSLYYGGLAGTSTHAGDYLVIVPSDSKENIVEGYNIFDTSYVRVAAIADNAYLNGKLSTRCGTLGAASLGNLALIAGGSHYYGESDYFTYVDVLNNKLTREKNLNLSIASSNLAGASVGNFALLGGGFDSTGTLLDTVDVFTLP